MIFCEENDLSLSNFRMIFCEEKEEVGSQWTCFKSLSFSLFYSFLYFSGHLIERGGETCSNSRELGNRATRKMYNYHVYPDSDIELRRS